MGIVESLGLLSDKIGGFFTSINILLAYAVFIVFFVLIQFLIFGQIFLVYKFVSGIKAFFEEMTKKTGSKNVWRFY